MLPRHAGELSAKPTEGATRGLADADLAPSTMLRMVPLPRYAREEPAFDPFFVRAT